MITTPITVESPTAPGVPPGTVLPAGPAGPSAYDIAVINGYVGTEASWLASLQGPAADTRALDAATSTAVSSATSATASAGAAASSATDAKLSSTSALASATTASQARSDAVAAAATAPGLAATAAQQAAAPAVASATQQAAAASTSASAAAGSATAAANSAAAAAVSKNWAMQTSGTVDGTYYSARYYALQAAASAASISSGPVTSVNTKTGVVVLAAADVGAAGQAPAGSPVPAADGVAALGISPLAAPLDHVHPSDPTRLATSRALAELAALGVVAQGIARQNLGTLSRGRILALAVAN